MVVITAVGVVYAKIVDNKETCYAMGGMQPNTGYVYAWFIPVCGQVDYELVVCQYASLW
jgi:hypothetical protein